MLKCLQLEEIERQLLEVPGIIDSYERRDSDFVSRLVGWLVDLERAFQQNRLPEAGAIAVKRAMMISAGRGVVPEGITVEGRMTRRKLKAAAAIYALRSAAGLAANSIEADRERHRQAREMVCRIVALAIANGPLGVGSRDAVHCQIPQGRKGVLVQEALHDLDVRGFVAPSLAD